MTLKSDPKFEEKLTCGLENEMRNLGNFHQSTWKSQNWDFDEIVLWKVENPWAQNFTEGLFVLTLRMIKNLKRNWLVVSKLAWGIWRILTWALESLKVLHFSGFLVMNVYNVSAKKVQRSCLSWHERLMQNFKKNWPVVLKMTWGIWRIFMCTDDEEW